GAAGLAEGCAPEAGDGDRSGRLLEPRGERLWIEDTRRGAPPAGDVRGDRLDQEARAHLSGGAVGCGAGRLGGMTSYEPPRGGSGGPAVRVLGPTVDDQTRCVHYAGPLDVIAIRFH